MSKLYSFHNLHTTATTFQVEVRFDPSHPVFAGHFPGHPVVPGVFLVEILAAAISEIAGKSLVVKEAASLKFLQLINPEVHGTVLLDGSIVADENEIYQVDATIRQGEVLFARMKSVKLFTFGNIKQTN
jgi:3-hydroxyacyl-[acyl-carrier-protein] dehydratase